jgi:hypothetical protein
MISKCYFLFERESWNLVKRLHFMFVLNIVEGEVSEIMGFNFDILGNWKCYLH